MSGVILKNDFHEMLNDEAKEASTESLDAHRHYNWWTLISAYSRCNLTFEKDKWPAIQGLAQQVALVWGQEMFYGLWAHNFARELLWQVRRRATRRLDTGAPSWSWLSVDSEVTNVSRSYFEKPHKCAEICKAPVSSIFSPRLSRFGEVRPPELLITACISGLVSTTRLDPLIDQYNCVLHGRKKDWKTRAKWTPDTDSVTTKDTFALHVFSYTPQYQVGLVIVPVDQVNRTWRRVGYYETLDSAAPTAVDSESFKKDRSTCGGIRVQLTLL
ncbi:hypothetical protein ACN47E_001062 [Coniothyrium glycines]